MNTLPEILPPLAQLSFLSSPPWNWGELEDIEAQLLKSHRNRLTTEIVLHTATGRPSAIGKFYTEDRSDVYRAMEAIARAGFGSEAEFSIPQPLAYISALNLLLQEKVAGIRAKDIFINGTDTERAQTAERCALWLARFHRLAPRYGPVPGLEGYFASLDEWSRRIAAAGKLVGDEAANLVSEMRTRASTLRSDEVCAGHGSFCHAQIIIDGRRTVTYDWDGYDVADPSRDVARFIAALARLALRHLGSIRALDSAAEIFRKTYVAASPFDIRRRLPFYRAGACIKIAKFEISKPVSASRQAAIEAMLEEASRSLKEWD